MALEQEYKITDKIIISDVKYFIDQACDRTKQNVEIDKIKEFIETEKGTIYYFGNDMALREDPDSMYTTRCFVDTGLLDTECKPLFLAFLKEGNEFRGHFIMTVNYMFNTYCAKYFQGNTSKLRDKENQFYLVYNKNKSERENKFIEFEKEEPAIKQDIVKEEPEISPVTRRVSGMIDSNDFTSVKGLDSHIKVIGSKIKYVIDNKLTAYYIKNELNDVIVNIGLRDKFGNSILLMYRYNVRYSMFYPEEIITSKEKAIVCKFKKEQLATLDLAPISFIIIDGEAGYVSDKIEDYDISYESLVHIIYERRERFPEGSEMLTDRDIAMKIKTALVDGVERCKLDKSYAKPIFSSKRMEMEWALPLKIFSNKEPELILIIRKCENFYEVKTVLPYDEAVKDRIRSSSMYQSDW